MTKAVPIEDEIAERVLHGLERVKLDEVADVGLKLGVEASCVIGAKFLLDLVPMEELLTWVEANPDGAKTMLTSIGYFFASGFSPLALAPMFKAVLDNEESKEKLREVVGSMGGIGITALMGFPLTILAYSILRKPSEVRGVFSDTRARAESAQAELNAVSIEYAEKVKRITEIISLMQQISESHDKEEHKIDLLMELEQEKLAIERVLPTMRARMKELEGVIAKLMSAVDEGEEALRRSAEILRWSIAFVVGTYAAASLIYARDTIFDVVKEAFNMFKLPFKGGV